MTIRKAKLYKTAQVTMNVGGFSAGQFVAVKWVRRGAFEHKFRISFPGITSVVVSESLLTGFVL